MTWRCWFRHRFSHTLGAPFVDDGRLKVRCSECAFVSTGVILPSITPVETMAQIASPPIVDLAAYRQAHERRTA